MTGAGARSQCGDWSYHCPLVIYKEMLPTHRHRQTVFLDTSYYPPLPTSHIHQQSRKWVKSSRHVSHNAFTPNYEPILWSVVSKSQNGIMFSEFTPLSLSSCCQGLDKTMSIVRTAPFGLSNKASAHITTVHLSIYISSRYRLSNLWFGS